MCYSLKTETNISNTNDCHGLLRAEISGATLTMTYVYLVGKTNPKFSIQLHYILAQYNTIFNKKKYACSNFKGLCTYSVILVIVY